MLRKATCGVLVGYVMFSAASAESFAASKAPAITRIFDVLDFTHPGLSEVKRLHEAGDDEAARRALHDYIRKCKWEQRLSKRGVLPVKRDPGYSDPIADDLLKNIFHLGPFTVCWGPKVSDIQWYEPPIQIIDDVHLFYGSGGMTRHDAFMKNAALAYWLTRDERYAAKLLEIVLDFIERCPIVDGYGVRDNENNTPAVDEDGDGKPDRPGCCASMMWKPFTTGRRMGTWRQMFIYCRDSESFTPDAWCRILCSINEHVSNLVEQLPTMGNRTNHVTRMGLAVLEICDFWPELVRVPNWRRVAIEKLGKAYNWYDQDGFIYPDGAQTEIAPEPGAVQAVGHIIETARAHGIAVPPNMLAVHEKMAEFAIGLVSPNAMYSGKYIGLGKRVDALHRRKDLLYITTGGKEGHKPDFVSWPPRSNVPSYAGTYFMRSAWEPDAIILRTRFGPMRYTSPCYGSGSMGEISVFAHAMPLIPFIGHSVYRGEFKSYGNAAFAGDGRSRNTISVDGVGQSRHGRSRYAEKPTGHPWITSPVFDYLRGSYTFDPKKLNKAKITHTRSILFVRPDYFIAIDRLSPSDHTEHEYRMKYQLHCTLVPQVQHARVTAAVDNVGIVVEPLRNDIRLDVIKGQKEPYYEGWHHSGSFKPAPALIYTWKQKGPTGTETLLYPFAATESGGDKVRAIAERADNGAAVLKITGHQPDTADHVLVGGKNGIIQAGGFELQGRLAFVRVSDGNTVAAGLVEGTSLKGMGLTLAFKTPASAWLQRQTDGSWTASSSCDGTITIHSATRPRTLPWGVNAQSGHASPGS